MSSDPRIAAFCAPGGPEVFSGVVFGNQIWAPDPFDVPEVHAAAREMFSRLLTRASAPDLPPTGKSLLILGEAGSGKTHLMRAFRTEAHASGTGYCGYMQMSSQSDNYPRYVLSYLLESLEQPYKPGAALTGLARLARGLLDALDWVSDEDKQKLCDDILEPDELARQVFRIADIAVQNSTFAKIDINVLRAVLFLLTNDPRIRPKILSWLRCEDLPPFDREALGNLVPRPGPEWPLRTIIALGQLMHAVHSSALVLLVDQLDAILETQTAVVGEDVRRSVNSLLDIADQLPNSVVVIGCLGEVYHGLARPILPKPKLDRLEHDPSPCRLAVDRTAEEIRAILARRLEVLYEAHELDTNPAQSLFPYTETVIAPLSGLPTRAVLRYFYEHHEACVRAGALVPLRNTKGAKIDQQVPAHDFEQLWSDFNAKAKPPLTDEPQLAELLAWAIGATSAEMGNGTTFQPAPDGRFVPTTISTPELTEQLIVAVCDKSARGGGLANQITEAAGRAKVGARAVFVRSTDYPMSGKALEQLAKLCAPVGSHRRVVVSNSDWRAMNAFKAFITEHSQKPGFPDWRSKARPLAALPAIRSILGLDSLERIPGKAASRPQTLPGAIQEGTTTNQMTTDRTSQLRAHVAAEQQATPKVALSATVPLGRTRSAAPVAVELEPKSLCRHAAFLGGSGSGKTTAALAVIEHLLRSGVPTVLLDRKGDLARYADPTAWDTAEPDTARAAARAALRDAIDVRLFTPGEPNGCPLAVPVVPPDFASFSTADREQAAQSTASAIGAMLDYKGASKQPRVVILQKALEALADVPSGAVSLGAIQKLVSDQDEALVSRFDGQFEDRHFKGLAEDLLVLNARHRRLFEGGERLSIDLLLGRGAHAKPGRTRLSIVSTQFLGDATTVDFWVSQLLIAAGRWAAKNPAPDKLQGVFMFDEADAYLPAVKVPATKGPMENLLKRARSAGIGLFLATQSPGDLDYKCRDQITTWLIGRVKEKVAIDKLKPTLEAKPGAADRLAEQKAGEFYLVREGDVQPVLVMRNLIPTEQVPEDRILALARASCTEEKPAT